MAKALHQTNPPGTSKRSTSAARRARLECRIDPTIKQRAEQAATLLGQDLSAFTENALNEKAQEVIEREERLVLSEQNFEKFVAALDNPPAPTQQLVAARRALLQPRGL